MSELLVNPGPRVIRVLSARMASSRDAQRADRASRRIPKSADSMGRATPTRRPRIREQFHPQAKE